MGENTLKGKEPIGGWLIPLGIYVWAGQIFVFPLSNACCGGTTVTRTTHKLHSLF